MTLTKPQAAALAYVRRYIAEHGYAPLEREISAHLGTSIATARHHVTGLVIAGMLLREAGRHRGLRLVECCAACGRKLEGVI